MMAGEGIEIDYCPKCRGVWLDRGELDKLVERGAAQQSPPQQPAPRQDDRCAGHQGYRRKSWLSDIFD